MLTERAGRANRLRLCRSGPADAATHAALVSLRRDSSAHKVVAVMADPVTAPRNLGPDAVRTPPLYNRLVPSYLRMCAYEPEAPWSLGRAACA